MSRKLKIAGVAGLPLVATLLVAAPTMAASPSPVPFFVSISGVGGFSTPHRSISRVRASRWSWAR